MKDGFYAERGWDVKTGWPTEKKLRALGLGDVADELPDPREGGVTFPPAETRGAVRQPRIKNFMKFIS